MGQVLKLLELLMDKVISTCLFGSSPRAYEKYAQYAPRSAQFLQQHLPD